MAPLLLAVGSLGLAADLAALLAGPHHTTGWRDAWLYDVAPLCAVLSSLGSARQLERRERVARGALVAGMALWCCGEIAAQLHAYSSGSALSAPSLPDALQLSIYPCACAALLLALRLRRAVASWAARLDGLIVGLGVASVYSFVFGLPARGMVGGVGAEVTKLGYPAYGLLLVALTAATAAWLGWQLDRFLVLFGLGAALFCLPDSHELAAAGARALHNGTMWDVAWPAGLLAWSLAVRQPDPRPARLHPRVLATTLAPIVVGVEAIGLLLAASATSIPAPVVVLAAASLLAVLVRTLVAFGEVAKAGEARRRALTDALTGLANRDALAQQIAATLAGPDQGPHALLLIGFDRVREVTDAFGHTVGDQLVAEVSRRVRRVTGPDSMLARFRDHELGLWARLEAPNALDELVEHVRRALAAPFPTAGMQIVVKPSIGVARAPEHAADASELMACADSALMIAWRSSAPHVSYSGRAPDAGRSRLVLVEQLRRATANDELVCLFQPKVEIASGRAVGAESLVRWRHPERGLLEPAEFVPLAQEVGLIGALSRRVLALVTAQLATWSEGGLDCKVAVNLTVTDLLDVELVPYLKRLVAAHGLQPGSLVVEVTEETFLRDPSEVRSALLELHDLGIEVSIDDYGSGYSSLAYLRGIPAEELKIDQAFVTGVAGDPTDQAIVAATAGLAHSLGMRVVAEGVEEGADVAVLGALGCDIAQGYYFARPLTARQFEEWLARAEAAAPG